MGQKIMSSLGSEFYARPVSETVNQNTFAHGIEVVTNYEYSYERRKI